MADQNLRLMAVHAHPDDEAVGTGGTLALYAERGAHTVLVTCTRGEEGEIVDPDLKATIMEGDPTPEEAQARLAVQRDKELADAVAALRLSAFYQLGYRDSGMAGTTANANPLAFTNVVPAEAAAKLIEIVRRERPHVMISYDEFGGYGHPDHIMAHRIALLAFAGANNTDIYPQQSEATPPWQPLKFYYVTNSRENMLRHAQKAQQLGIEVPFAQRAIGQERAILLGEPVDPENPSRPPFGAPEDSITTFIDVGAVIEQKRDALRVHRSQAVSSGSFILGIPDELARSAFGTEFFILTRSRVPASRPETDLFAGIEPD